MNEELHIFPTFQQNYVWTKDSAEGSPNDESITFQTADGLSINADIGIQFRIEPSNVGKVFQTYRKGIDELTDGVLRSMVRDAFVTYASKYSAEEAYSTKKAELKDSVDSYVKRTAILSGITVDKVSYIGSMRLPPEVISSLNAKIQAVQTAQMKENELRSAKADAEKTIATADGEARSILLRAEAQSKANKILAASITRELVEYEKIKKWDGQLPQVAGGAGTIVDLR
jgi:regulator of protease activity HflC (stomatin/prohibitin superfamily)